MNYRRHQIILAAVDGLRKAKSWTGKTHVQKTLFLTKAVLEPELPFEFVLYKHGPYSFEIDEELEEMVSYDAVRFVPQPPYGPSLRASEGRRFPDAFGDASNAELEDIQRIAEFVGTKGVVELEALATAIWVRTHQGVDSDEDILQGVKALKPHLHRDVLANGVQDSQRLVALAAV